MDYSRRILQNMYIAVDVGGTKTFAAIFNADGEKQKEIPIPTDPDYDTFVAKLIETIDELDESRDWKSMAIALPGWIDYENGIAKYFGNLGWQDIDIKHRLEAEFSKPVFIENDANLGALGEAHTGAGKGFDTVLYVTISTGIGTGVTYKGRLDLALRHSEGGAMHFVHDGEIKQWEHFASGKAFVERFNVLGKDTDDPEIWSRFAQDLSLGMGNLIAVIQPDILVIGGSMGEHLHKYLSYLQEGITSHKSPMIVMPGIVKAAHPTHAVINGAYVLASSNE